MIQDKRTMSTLQAPSLSRAHSWPALCSLVAALAATLAPALLAIAQATGGAAEAKPVESKPAPRVIVSGTIDGDVDNVAAAYVTRLVAEAKRREADALLLQLDTFGGRVDSAIAIRDAIADLEIPTAVFINRRAISAGALISFAFDKIAMSPGGTFGAATPVMSGPGTEVPQAVEEKYLSYFRQEMRATAELKGRNGDVAEAMVDPDKEIEGISEKGKLLTLTTTRAVELEIADYEARTAEEFLAKLGWATSTEELARSWSEGLVGFLTSQPVASLLFLVMMVCAYLEYHTPGFGVFGGTAIGCFCVLFFSHYLVNLAGWEEMILFVVGLALLLVEIFVLPGFGVAGILGLFAILLAGVMVLLAGDWSDLSFRNPFTLDAIQRVLLSTVAGIGVLLLILRFLPKTGLTARPGLMLATALAGEQGYVSHAEDEDFAGQTGLALTPLRPSGRIEVGGKRFEARTEGEFVAKGDAVTILRRDAAGYLVRRA